MGMVEIELDVGDVISIGDDVEIKLKQIRPEKVAIGVIAPRALRILRVPRYDDERQQP
jgi:sRNA-binding carbon storage regulator CsrA